MVTKTIEPKTVPEVSNLLFTPDFRVWAINDILYQEENTEVVGSFGYGFTNAEQLIDMSLTGSGYPVFLTASENYNFSSTFALEEGFCLWYFTELRKDNGGLGCKTWVDTDYGTETFGININNAGAGYTNGAQVLTVVQAGGSGGTINVTVAGNVVVSIDSVATVGSGYTVADGLATTGGGGAGCTVNLLKVGESIFLHDCQVYEEHGTVTDILTGRATYMNSRTIKTLESGVNYVWDMWWAKVRFGGTPPTITPISLQRVLTAQEIKR